jgi:hypothetical protein
VTSHLADDDSVAQYVAGTMPAGELEGFEQHLLTCEECRAAVRAGAAARVAMVTPAGGGTTATATHRTRRVRLPWLAAAAAAAVVVFVLANRQDESLKRLGEISPAPFVAGALRPSGDASTALVDSGMAAYSASHFGAAADRLERASRRDSSAAVAFFLGVSLLMRGNDSAALAALERVSKPGPYAGEGTYFAAKALVRLNRPDSAIALLERSSSAGVMTARLQSFADSIRRR